MITLYCHPGYRKSFNLVDAMIRGLHPRCPEPRQVLPLLVEEDLLRNPAAEAVLQRLTQGAVQLDPDPCYLVCPGGTRRPVFCFNPGWQAALAVAAVAGLPRDSELLRRMRQRFPAGPLIPVTEGNLCLELTPELCSAPIWRALNALEQPVDLAADVRALQLLRQALEADPPKEGQEAPYRLVREGPLRPLTVLTNQETSGREGNTLLTQEDGFDEIAFHWQDPRSWCRGDLVSAMDGLPRPRFDPALPGLETGYTIRDRIRQNSLDRLESGADFCLMVLERDAVGSWQAWEVQMEDCPGYRALFDEALRGAGQVRRWVLAAELSRPPLCLQELTECPLLLGFRLYKDIVTLTDGDEALCLFLQALDHYKDAFPAHARFFTGDLKEGPYHV